MKERIRLKQLLQSKKNHNRRYFLLEEGSTKTPFLIWFDSGIDKAKAPVTSNRVTVGCLWGRKHSVKSNGHTWDEVLHHVHVWQRVDARVWAGLVNVRQAREAVLAVDVHRTRATNTLTTAPAGKQ